MTWRYSTTSASLLTPVRLGREGGVLKQAPPRYSIFVEGVLLS